MNLEELAQGLSTATAPILFVLYKLDQWMRRLDSKVDKNRSAIRKNTNRLDRIGAPEPNETLFGDAAAE
jgi:hypothetical protein